MAILQGADWLPEDAKAYNVRYARWDGGPIHIAKGIHSHWPYLAEPRSIYAMSHWYDPGTIEFLKEAGINWIWATWSVGFPPEDEELQWRQVSEYINRCHDVDIRVTAYVSLTNMFRDLWLRRNPASADWFQMDRQGGLIPYLASYHPGRRTRFLACLSHPEWQDHLWMVARRALEAGVDGLMYDNAGSGCQCPRCQEAFRIFALEEFNREYGELPDFGPVVHGIAAPYPGEAAIQEYGQPADEQSVMIWHKFVNSLIGSNLERIGVQSRAINPKILLYSNTNADMDVFGYPACQVVTTEDVREPGIFDGKLTHNTGLLRLLQATADGWKPVRLEYAVGHSDGEIDPGLISSMPANFLNDATRFVPMTARKQQLTIAEAAMYAASVEITPEGYFSVGLFFNKPWTRERWSAIGAYHRFLKDNSDIYVGAQSIAKTAVLLNDNVYTPGDEQHVHMLNGLSGAGFDFDVIFDRHLDHLDIHRYTMFILPDTRYLSDVTLSWLDKFSLAGGRVFSWDPNTQSDFLASIAPAINAWTPISSCVIQAPQNVLSRITYQPRLNCYRIHLLNYSDHPTSPIEIHSGADFTRASYPVKTSYARKGV